MPSFEKNKSSGLWSVRFRETEDGLTKNKRLSGFKTKKDAQYGYEEYVAEQKRLAEEEKNKKPTEVSLTFGELAGKYFDFEKGRIKASSYYDLTKKVTNKILPFFENCNMEDITPVSVLEWQNTISNYSYRYQKDLFTHLASIFNFAEKYYDVKNVMQKVDRPRNLEGKKEMLIYSPTEFRCMIDCVNRPDYKMLFSFLYVTGCRRGEALAISWDDIDFAKKHAKISKSVAYKVGENGKSYKITTPKNDGSVRTIVLPSFIVEQLREYRALQLKDLTPEEINFVFGGKDPLPPTSIERALTNAAAKAGVKRIRIHDLRHSCASYLIHKGVSIVAVSRHLGHSSTKQTLDTYSHLLPDDSEIIRGRLDELFKN